MSDSLPSGPLDRQSTPCAPQTSSPPPTNKQDHDPSLGSTNSTVFLVGGAVVAGLLVLLIVILLYFLVFRGRSKFKITDRRKSHTSQDDGEESDADITETQLHGVTSRCDQENYHISSAGERSVESPREIVTAVVTSDLHQRAETKHDQDNVDKPLATETDGSVKDGEKRNDKHNNPESMYAMVDKRRPKSQTLGAVSTEEVSRKVSGDRKDETDKAETLSSLSKHGIPSEHQKSTVAVKNSLVPGRVVCRVIPYHLSIRRLNTTTEAQAALQQTADHGEDGINSPEEETVCADIGNK